MPQEKSTRPPLNPSGLCQCGCGGRPKTDALFLIAHHKRLKRQEGICKVCGSTFRDTPSRMKERRTCDRPECKAATHKGMNQGFRHSLESRRKQSEVKKGPQYTVTCDCGCGTEFDVKQSTYQKSTTNRFYVDWSHYKRFLLARSQERIPNDNTIYYGPDWDSIRDAIRQRDRVCQHCGKTPEANGNALHVHHLIPFRISPNNDPSNLEALCNACHMSETRKEHKQYPDLLPPPKRSYTAVCTICNRIFDTDDAHTKVCSDACKARRSTQWTAAYWEKQKEQNTERYQRRAEKQRVRQHNSYLRMKEREAA